MNTALINHCDDEPATTASSRDRIRAIVAAILASHTIDGSFSDDDGLAEIGVGSVDMVALLLAIESDFNIEVPQHEITPEVFQSVASIGAMIKRLALQPAAGARNASWCLTPREERKFCGNVPN